MTDHVSRYVLLMREWAGRALDASSAAPMFVQSPDPPVSLGAAAARLLLGQSEEPWPTRAREAAASLAQHVKDRGTGQLRFVDTFGFTRPVYYPLLVHVHLLAVPDASPLWEAVCEVAPPASASVELSLWWSLCRYEAATRANRPAEIAQIEGDVDAIVHAPGERGSLHHRLGLDDLLDAWTFRELAGLHALQWLARLKGCDRWQRRVREIAVLHQDITQPDYTTYQPWGVPAFLETPSTAWFGEQQLHDAVTNIHVERGGAGLIPGLLLADAATALGWASRPYA